MQNEEKKARSEQEFASAHSQLRKKVEAVKGYKDIFDVPFQEVKVTFLYWELSLSSLPSTYPLPSPRYICMTGASLYSSFDFNMTGLRMVSHLLSHSRSTPLKVRMQVV